MKSFNEAPAKSGGECPPGPDDVRRRAASMRPPRKAGGNQVVDLLPASETQASMRPPRKAGGNPSCFAEAVLS